MGISKLQNNRPLILTHHTQYSTFYLIFVQIHGVLTFSFKQRRF